MKSGDYFLRLHALDGTGTPHAFLGTAFPVGPHGSLLTCRHCVEGIPETSSLAVYWRTKSYVRLPPPQFPREKATDLAYFPDAIPGDDRGFIPILPGEKLIIGEDVYTYGYFKLGADVERGYFSGRIVNMRTAEPKDIYLTLPFAILEGMSGSPVLTYHNGPKLVGVARGNRQSRVLASEIQVVESLGERHRETIHRVCEFGIATHCAVIVDFLVSIGENRFLKTADTVEMRWLE